MPADYRLLMLFARKRDFFVIFNKRMDRRIKKCRERSSLSFSTLQIDAFILSPVEHLHNSIVIQSEE